MIDRFPWMVEGNAVEGLGVPPRGLVRGVGAVDGGVGTTTLELELADCGVTGGEYLAQAIIAGGSRVADVSGGSLAIAMPSGRAGERAEARPFTLSWPELARLTDDFPLSGAPTVGCCVVLSWTDQPTADDFAAYVVYWDEGDAGGGVDHELAVVESREVLTWTTAELTDGETYRFALAYRDRAGNESSAGSPASVTVAGVPLPVEALEATLDGEVVLLEWTLPAGQVADAAGIVVLDNMVPGFGLGTRPAGDDWMRRGRVAANVVEWESGVLWPGRWVWAVVVVTSTGAMSAPALVELTLRRDGATMVTTTATPAAPLLDWAEPAAGGAIRSRCRLDTEAALTLLEVLEDGSQVDTVALTGALVYEYTSGAHGDGLEVVVSWRATAGSGADAVTAESAALTVVCDAAAPSGDGVLTAGLGG